MNYKEIKTFITSERKPFFLIAKKYMQSSDKVLDVGAGDGLFAGVVGRQDIYMIDGNHYNVELLQKKYPNVKYSKLPEIPFDNNFFDIIHCSHVVEHLQPQELYDFLKECDRCLKTQGYLIISSPTLWFHFYNDLSHDKPYNPIIFKRYLICGDKSPASRKLISNQYKLIEEVYRYNPVQEYIVYEKNTFFSKIAVNIYKFIKYIKVKAGIRHLEISGFTLVLQKNTPFLENNKESDVY